MKDIVELTPPLFECVDQQIRFCIGSSEEPIIVLEKGSFWWRGERVEDIKKIYEAFSSWLTSVSTKEYITLIVNSYDFNRNAFTAITDQSEVVEFDPFGGCAIELSDEEYYQQSVAPTIVGHKFVVKSLDPLPNELVFTTWKDKRAEA